MRKNERRHGELLPYLFIYFYHKQQFIDKELKVYVKDKESFPKIQNLGQMKQVDKFPKVQNKTYTLHLLMEKR